jgi:aryl-alcohol dehydrogenase-like predicted oxidoreductase
VAVSFKDLDADQTQATLILNSLSNAGGNLFDATAVYLGSEAFIGEAISYRLNIFWSRSVARSELN